MTAKTEAQIKLALDKLSRMWAMQKEINRTMCDELDAARAEIAQLRIRIQTLTAKTN